MVDGVNNNSGSYSLGSFFGRLCRRGGKGVREEIIKTAASEDPTVREALKEQRAKKIKENETKYGSSKPSYIQKQLKKLDEANEAPSNDRRGFLKTLFNLFGF